MRKVLKTLAVDLRSSDGLDLSQYFTRGTFIVAKKELPSGKNQAGQRHEVRGVTEAASLSRKYF
jgi:hypothetical protein